MTDVAALPRVSRQSNLLVRYRDHDNENCPHILDAPAVQAKFIEELLGMFMFWRTPSGICKGNWDFIIVELRY